MTRPSASSFPKIIIVMVGLRGGQAEKFGTSSALTDAGWLGYFNATGMFRRCFLIDCHSYQLVIIWLHVTLYLCTKQKFLVR